MTLYASLYGVINQRNASTSKKFKFSLRNLHGIEVGDDWLVDLVIQGLCQAQGKRRQGAAQACLIGKKR